MKIRTKLFTTFLIIGIVLTASAIALVYFFATSNITTETSQRLEGAAYSRVSNINTFLELNKNRVADFTAHDDIRNCLTDLSDLKVVGCTSQQLTAIIAQAVTTASDDVIEVFTTNTNGTVNASTEGENIGSNISDEAFFRFAKERLVFGDLTRTAEGTDYFSVSTPIVNNEEVVGVVVMRLAPDAFYEIFNERTGLGETGEVFVLNNSKTMITPSRFEKNVILKKEVKTSNAERCFSENEQLSTSLNIFEELMGGSLRYRDYRDTSVIGTHVYVPEMRWCVLAKMDNDEMLSLLNDRLKIIGWVGLGVVVIIYFIALWVSRLITKPITKLHEGTEIIEQGDLNYKVATDSNDEIGILSRAFDKMTTSLRISRSEVDKKVEEQTRAIREQKGELENQQTALLNVLKDVENEKERSQAFAQDLEKFQLAVENASDHIAITDPDGVILYVNPAAERITGYDQKSMVGKIENLLDPSNKLVKREDQKKIWETIRDKKEIYSGDLVGKRKNGEHYDVAVSIAPILNGKSKDILFYASIQRDITREKEIDRAKTEFVSLASHQLRTPLSTINWYAEMLLDGDAGELKDQQRQYLEEIYKGNQRMVGLVRALLNVSRIELGTFMIEPEPVKVTDIALSVLNTLQHEIKEKKIDFKKTFAKGIPVIQADTKLIRIIFTNLLSNAVKYTPENGKITLSIELVKADKKKKNTEHDHILIKVSDTGLGIPKDQQDKIFTKLFRADNVREQDTDGTGLGLYIVNAICDQCDGKVWFDSEENKGTTFYVTLPIKGMKKREGTRRLD